MLITQLQIDEARAILKGKVHRTPLVPATTIGKQFGAQLYLKCENLQRTGSFKPRGALNKVAHLSAEEKAKGLIAVSAGNHAQGVAYAAQREGLKATIVMPENAPQAKADATRGYGAEVVLFGTIATIFEKAYEIQRECGYTFVHPFDDPYVIAGQATIGMEILEDVPDVDVIAVQIGGGGLLSGIAAAIKLNKPSVRVIGVESASGPAMQLSIQQGKIARITRGATIADGMGAPFVGELTLEHTKHFVDELVTVDDEEIKNAMRWILQRSKLLTEGAGAGGTAAFLSGKVAVKPGAKVVTILSGGNIDFERLKSII
ncbi:MAG TPA: threonine/serine dehydratase [Candidatus Eremiobacteraceae bacterium]|nr:threonine/serine dehydratase [Candidatus Eremiobacteraceae bacterium]